MELEDRSCAEPTDIGPSWLSPLLVAPLPPAAFLPVNALDSINMCHLSNLFRLGLCVPCLVTIITLQQIYHKILGYNFDRVCFVGYGKRSVDPHIIVDSVVRMLDETKDGFDASRQRLGDLKNSWNGDGEV